MSMAQSWNFGTATLPAGLLADRLLTDSMLRRHSRLVRGDAEVQAYARRLMERACRVQLPRLLDRSRPGALHRVESRNGITTVAFRRGDLFEDEVREILTYRLGQYLHPAVSIVDPRLVCEAQLEYEPADRETMRDIHFASLDSETGLLLCYATLRAVPGATDRQCLGHEHRPQLPIETVHGQGLFNRLERIPDLALTQVYELGRYVKNQGLHPLSEKAVRAPTEVALAVFRTLLGPLRSEVEAFVGDLEINVAKQTLDFFHVPVVLVKGVIPYSPEFSYFYPRNQHCTVYPFAALTEDVERTVERLGMIESALEAEGREGLRQIFALKRTAASPLSTLEPPEGLPALATEEIPDQGGSMAQRKEVLETAEDLRAFDPFQGLTEAERRLLGGFMEREEYPAGTLIVRQGDDGHDLFLIDEGIADVLVDANDLIDVPVAQLGPGSYFGEIGLLRGGKRTADVRAHTDLAVYRLTRDAYRRFMARLEDVEARIQRMARRRERETQRRLEQVQVALA